MCCCSYLDAQVCGEGAKARTYYRTRPTTTLSTDWIYEEDSPDISFHSDTRNPPYQNNECHQKLTSVSSKETATTVVLADTESFEGDDRREGWRIIPANKAPPRYYDKENSFIEESRFNCGMPLYNFQVNRKKQEEVVLKSEQKVGGYSRHVLREVQQEGRANLPFLHTTQGIAC
jgi:hypothetical protein